jgi:hypothetical protein
MQVLSTPDLIGVWEQGLSKSLVKRALILLSAACPDVSIESMAQLSIGQRDRLLLSLREQIFGPQLVSIVSCPACGEQLELMLQVADIQVPPLARTVSSDRLDDLPKSNFSLGSLLTKVLPSKVSGVSAAVSTSQPPTPSSSTFSLSMDGYEVHFRLPNSYDLLKIDSPKNLLDGQQSLLGNCLISVQKDGISQSLDRLPDELVEAIATKMAELDPQAEVFFALACPACNHQWQSPFDIVSFFWSELNAWAIRLLKEVHILAAAYGWQEMDILTMNPYRRQCYLEMVLNR